MRTTIAMSASDECPFLATGSLDRDTFEEEGGCATPRDSAFRKMVHKIANRLDRSNVESIVFLHNLPQDLNASTSLKVLNCLYERDVFSRRNVQPLKDLLQSINRSDLASDVVEDYLTRIGKYNSTPVPKSPKLFTTRTRHYSVEQMPIAEETMTRGYGTAVPHIQFHQADLACTIALSDSQGTCPLPSNAYDASSDQTRKIPESPRPRSNSWKPPNTHRPERQSSAGNFLTVGPSNLQSGPPSSVSSLSPFSSTNSLMDDHLLFTTSSPVPVPSTGDPRHNDSFSRLSSRSNTPYTPSPSPSFPNSQEDTLHTSSAPKNYPLHHANTCPHFQQHNDQQTQTVEAIHIPMVYDNNTPNTGTSPPVHPTMSYQLEVRLVPSTAPIQRANFAQTLSAAKSDSRLNEVSPQDLNRSSSQSPVQQSEIETKHQPHTLSSNGNTPDLLEGACGPQPQRLTTDSAESRGVEDTRLLPPIAHQSQSSSCESHTRERQRPQSGKSARKLRLPWKTTASTSQEISWRLKRSELNEAICEHREQKFFSSPHKLVVDFGHGKANPRLALRLFPYGLETDREKNATLEICIEVPRKCPRLHSSAKADILLSVWDCKENALLSNKQHLSVSMNMRTVLVSDFISHDHLRRSRSEYVEIKADIQMPTSPDLQKS